jgi:hypothetical protein
VTLRICLVIHIHPRCCLSHYQAMTDVKVHDKSSQCPDGKPLDLLEVRANLGGGGDRGMRRPATQTQAKRHAGSSLFVLPRGPARE